VESVLADSPLQTNAYLRLRIVWTRIIVVDYHRGDYSGAARGVRELFAALGCGNKMAMPTPPFDELANSEFCDVKRGLADLLVSEGGIKDNYQESLRILRDWKPLHPESPSTREMIYDGGRHQTLGKVLKDQGNWEHAAEELTWFLKTHATPDSDKEGWASGDLAHCLLELQRVKDAEEVLGPRLRSRLEQRESRVALVRRNDTMFLEIMSCEVLLCKANQSIRGRNDAPERDENLNEAEIKLGELRDRFECFGALTYTEAMRAFFVLCDIARCHQKKRLYKTALLGWSQALEHADRKLNQQYKHSRWGRESFFAGVISLSMANCLFALGEKDEALGFLEQALFILYNTPRRVFWVGLGTYWLDEMIDELRECLGIQVSCI